MLMEGIMRDQFPIFNSKHYFLTCAVSPLANRVKLAVEKFTREWDTYAGYALSMENGWSASVDKAREEFAKQINAKKEQVAYSFGVTVSSNSILSCFDNTTKNEFLFTDIDFPAVPANIIAKSDHDATYQIAKSHQGKIEAEDFVNLFSNRTAMLCISEVMANNGFRIDLDNFVEKAHDNDIPLFLDTYQSAGYIPIDVKKSDIDFLATGTQKYLIGGFGMSFMYMREDWIEKLNPASIGWFGAAGVFDSLFNGIFDKLTRPKDITKFHLGSPYVNGAATAIAGMNLLSEIGIDRIYNHNMQITQEIIDMALDQGYKVQTPIDKDRRGSIVNILVPNAKKIVEELRAIGIIVDYRTDGIRVAPHFYNDSSDVSALFSQITRFKN